MKTQVNFDVRPRYTCGSPAQVDEFTARRVARQERESYDHRLEGAYGEAERKSAVERGLGAIVFSWREHGKKIDVVDLITGERVTRANFVPRGACNIFALHPDDAKKGKMVKVNHLLTFDSVDPDTIANMSFWGKRYPDQTVRLLTQIERGFWIAANSDNSRSVYHPLELTDLT